MRHSPKEDSITCAFQVVRHRDRSIVGCFSRHGRGSGFYGLSATLDAGPKTCVAVITGAFGIATARRDHALHSPAGRDRNSCAESQEALTPNLRTSRPYIEIAVTQPSFATAVLHAYVVGAPAGRGSVRDFRDCAIRSLDQLIADEDRSGHGAARRERRAHRGCSLRGSAGECESS